MYKFLSKVSVFLTFGAVRNRINYTHFLIQHESSKKLAVTSFKTAQSRLMQQIYVEVKEHLKHVKLW